MNDGLARGTGLDTSIPHSARIWNYWLGGKDNFEVDRQVGDQIRATIPNIATLARAQRAFLGRAVSLLVNDHGIRQFIDIGTGLPTHGNTHEVAQRLAPEARVVYVDNDPLVLAHARALLTGTPEGACAYIDADLREPEVILTEAAKTVDLNRPVGLFLLGVTAHVVDDEVAYAIVGRLLEALVPGSYLALSDETDIVDPEAVYAANKMWNESSDNPRVPRSLAQLSRFFDGLELLEPGVVSVSQWRTPSSNIGRPEPVDTFGGVARKPVMP